MRLKELFSKAQVRTGTGISLVEVEKPQRVPAHDEDSARVVGSLQSHPGFLYLLQKLKFHRQLLKENLATNRQTSLEDVLVLQSGIAWAGWLQGELDKAVGFENSKGSPPSQTERTIFEESQRQLEILR